jgi:hypothetical protein
VAVRLDVETLRGLFQRQALARRVRYPLLFRLGLAAVTVIPIVLVVGPVVALGLRAVVLVVLVRRSLGLVVVLVSLGLVVLVGFVLVVLVGLVLVVLVGLGLGLVVVLVDFVLVVLVLLVGLGLGLVVVLVVLRLVLVLVLVLVVGVVLVEILLVGEVVRAQIVLFVVAQSQLGDPVEHPVRHVADHVGQTRGLPDHLERVELAQLRRL